MKQKNHMKSVEPLVSVVIPVFNGASHIEEAVRSVRKSTYKRIEILLIDDGSKDQSKTLCHALEQKYDNVRFYSFGKNEGLGRVLNYAIARAKGEFICRLNQDDIMLPHRIATQVQFLSKRQDVVAVGSSIRLFTDSGQSQIVRFLQTDEQIKRVWHIVSPFSDPSVMYRKKVAVKVGGYKQEFWPADDTHLWIRMGTVGKLANIQKPLVDVRYHNKAASIQHFRRLAQVTYTMHRWMHEHIQKASVAVQLFWVGELLAGLILSPHINWRVYREIKKVLYRVNTLANFVRSIIPKGTISMPKVMIQPAIAKRSGQ